MGFYALKQTMLRVGLVVGFLAGTVAIAEQSGRPDDLTLGNFQSGPHNRWAFSHIREVMPTAEIAHDKHRTLQIDTDPDAGDDFTLPFQGKTQRLSEIAVHQYLDGILIIKDGQIIVERYFGELTAERPHLMMSVTKSVVGLLAGVLAERGQIDLSKTIADYVPALAASGWGPDSLRAVLDMRDGADYTEEYEDLTSTVRLQDCAAGWTDADYCPKDGPRGGYEFFPTVGRNANNVGRFVYKSGSTDVIGWVLEQATGTSLAQLISQYIWQPMGAEFNASITVDAGGFALGDGGMNATLRDLGRFGLLVLNEGKAFDEQVVPAAFIADIRSQSGDPDWPYDSTEGLAPYYRSFWWGVGNGEGDIMGSGIHGQSLHVAPEANMVIAMYASWPRADGDGESHGWSSLDALDAALVERFR